MNPTPPLSPGDVTVLLEAWTRGDRDALAEITEKVYPELRKIAAAYLMDMPGSTFQPTALINELFLKIVGETKLHFEDRRRFFGFSAKIMRRVLVDHLRSRQRVKRGGTTSVDLPLETAPIPPMNPKISMDAVLAVDEAVTQLESIDEMKARVLELRYFAGLSVVEIAEVLNTSERNVHRKLAMARKWLAWFISDKDEKGDPLR